MSMETNVIYEFEQFRLDPQERLLQHGGEQVKLTQKELNTLLVLVESRGRLITKQELIAKVWPNVHINDHNVDVTMSRVREALGQDQSGNIYIQTVPKEGYRFSVAVQIKDRRPTVVVSPGESAPASSDPNLAAAQDSDCIPAIEPKRPNLALPAQRINWRTLFLSFFLAALVGVLIFFLIRSTRSAHLLRFEPLTDDGQGKDRLLTDGARLFYNEFEVNRHILVSSPIRGGPPQQIDTQFSNVDVQDISNDGQRILVSSFEGVELAKRLWTISVDGRQAHPVGDALCRFARWSPDNRHIACVIGTTALLLNSDGLASHTLGSFPSGPTNLMWSPSGDLVRFVLSDNTGTPKSAWEIAVDKSGNPSPASQSKLPLDSCLDWTWTKNDKNFLCVKRRADGQHSVSITRKSHWWNEWGHKIQLPVTLRSIETIIPAETENKVYLLQGGADRGELLKFDAQKKTFEAYIQRLRDAIFLSFSRDGQWVTYQSTLDNSLWRSRVDGTDAIRLTQPPMAVEFSAWSPNDRQIAFMGQFPGKPWRIYLIGRDGGTPIEASNGNDGQGAPTWSADGKKIAYGNVSCEETQTCWIRWIDLSAKRADRISGSHGFKTARWSPDGNYIAALQNESYELMLFDVEKRQWTVLADSVTGDNINWSSDSHAIYAESSQGPNPKIEEIRIKDRRRTAVVDLTPLQNVPGRVQFWFGLTPDDSPILLHGFAATEVYVLEWEN